jgi:hypothetical protein
MKTSCVVECGGMLEPRDGYPNGGTLEVEERFVKGRAELVTV